jgi:hypothetical protein
MEAICLSETSVDFQRTTRRYIQEDSTLYKTKFVGMLQTHNYITFNVIRCSVWRFILRAVGACLHMFLNSILFTVFFVIDRVIGFLATALKSRAITCASILRKNQSFRDRHRLHHEGRRFLV